MKTGVLDAIGEADCGGGGGERGAGRQRPGEVPFSLLQIAAAAPRMPTSRPPTCGASASPAASRTPRWTRRCPARGRMAPCDIPHARTALARVAAELRLMAAPVCDAGTARLRRPAGGAAVGDAAAADDLLDRRRDRRDDRAAAGRPRQPAPARHGPAQGAEPPAGGAGARDVDGAAGLRAGRGGPAAGRRLHGRAESHCEAEVRSSRPRHHRHARRRAAGDPERHRHHRCARDGDPCRGPGGQLTYTDVHPERLRFFQDLLGRPIGWEAARPQAASSAGGSPSTSRPAGSRRRTRPAAAPV